MTKGTARKRARGQASYHVGQAAEAQVAALYANWAKPVAQRWRGQGGEIDLIFDDDISLVFVEVKHARSFDAALNSLRDRQIARICTAAEEFAGHYKHVREMRFDVALVNGVGEIRLMHNVLAKG